MQTRHCFGFALAIVLAFAASTQAQSPREQLQQLTIQLQQTPTDNVLRERIIKLGAEIKPAPAVPEEAIRYEGRAQFAFKSAKSAWDFYLAAQEYDKALKAAPWVLGYYSDLCTIYEKAEIFGRAKTNCELYLTGLFDPDEMTDVKRRIAGFEFAIEKNQSDQTKAVERFNSLLSKVNGVRYRSAGMPSGGYFEAQVQNESGHTRHCYQRS